ncbi:hypothetical protein TPHA_0K00130 [Tetrapisispora phaffii CBS 4417]|uniref:DUF3020 domain-containing protein n=1 Tax=Tetrapisispora phaffii (strain ATCC 24235 / CBS 4417 / NBRC 1672 / NRRL Y-8282 / UCD 70-5) TaxID=1071381 RepID=G8BZ19_TETPH|nr:hypothetical protein TPHA_0K00130 [Tetrapisispora phaffii CBS 4417]CCE65147.1 hypothetical protein TPHA_0K00130 [Tetrapisispora phaffii CBS 4417]
MSDEENSGEDMNFNALVGNILNNHEEVHAGSNVLSTEHLEDIHNDDSHPIVKLTMDHELPDFGTEDMDLEAVVNAIHNFNENTDDITEHHEEQSAEKEDIESRNENQQWAHALQQSLLQATTSNHSTTKGHIIVDDELDQDDMNLRNAILDSLQQLDKEKPIQKRKSKAKEAEDTQKSKSGTKQKMDQTETPKSTEELPSDTSKKHQRRRKNEQRIKTSNSTNKIKSKKSKKKSDRVEDDSLLNFEDVIKGFMQQDDNTGKKLDMESGDLETQALVEATLKAFEKELMDSQTTKTPTEQKKATNKKKAISSAKIATTTNKRKTVTKKASTTKAKASLTNKKEPATLNKKKSKDKKPEEISYGDDDFSKALAEMVNQVVNTSISDKTNKQTNRQTDVIPPITAIDNKNKQPELQDIDQAGDENFDLNQIMQRALAMAFQEQTQQDVDQSVVDDFNRGLDSFGVSDILVPSKATSEKKKSNLKKKVSKSKSINYMVKPKKISKSKLLKKKSKSSMLPKVPKEKKVKVPKTTKVRHTKVQLPFKFPKPSKHKKNDSHLKRRLYRKLAIEAANVARQKLRENKHAYKERLKSEQKKVSEQRKLRKVEEKENLEKERKELEEIVSKGPPYPADLRLTKRGEPKKPYRRWTPEEMAIRAQMPLEEPKRPKKIKKPKKKSKKLKKIPLSTLRKIPLFNISKGNGAVTSDSVTSRQYAPLSKYRMELNKLAPPSSNLSNELDTGNLNSIEIYKSRVVQEKLLLFDPSVKTIVRKEKWAFHPPWSLPEHPPHALPVARRKGKTYIEKLKDSKKKSKAKKSFKNLRNSLTNNARNNIIPAILFPIINTLKSAARAKVAAGASPEEATRHMMTIIQHTKRSIAHSLALSRRNAAHDYTTFKSEDDIISSHNKQSLLKKIPIFSLSSIRKINTAETTPPTIIKLEHNEDLEKAKLRETGKDLNNSLVSTTSPSDHNIGKTISQFSTPKSNDVTSKGDTVYDTNNTSPSLLPEDLTSTSSIKSSDILHIDPLLANISTTEHTSDDEEKPSLDVQSQPTNPVSVEKEQLILQANEPISDNAVREPNAYNKNNFDETDLTITRVIQSSKATPAIVKIEPKQESSYEPDNMTKMVESLIQKHIDKSNNVENDVVLPSHITNMISSTISTLLPALDDSNDKDHGRRAYTKPPPPVLNLDGLVPPSGVAGPVVQRPPLTKIIKPELGLDTDDIRQSRSLGFKKKASSEQPKELSAIKFNIPKNIGNKRSGAVKYARLYLNKQDMSTLTKEINKERKRKWRSANIVKNWENDVRARLKKRSKIELIDLTDEQKTNWVNNEFQKRKTEFMIKNEDSADSTSDLSFSSGSNGSSNITENEVLNMIANILKREDIAHKIEQNLIDDMDKAVTSKTKRRKLDDKNTQNINTTLV